MRKSEPLLFRLLLVAGGYALLSPFVWLVTQDFFHVYLVWNLALSLVPLVLALLVERGKVKRTGFVVVLVVLWVLFLPNALYITTDLLYLADYEFVVVTGPYLAPIYLDLFPSWLALFHIAAGAFIAAYAGTWSIALMMQTARRYAKKSLVSFGIILVTLLEGFGVYIGRFFRYNSWDLAQIFQILQNSIDAFSWNLVGFIVTVAILQLGLLVLLQPSFQSV